MSKKKGDSNGFIKASALPVSGRATRTGTISDRLFSMKPGDAFETDKTKGTFGGATSAANRFSTDRRYFMRTVDGKTYVICEAK